MLNEVISKNELTENRTPSELWNWLIAKVNQISSTKDGMRNLRLQRGLVKQLMEEVAPLALFGKRKFGDTAQILVQPVIGNQNYDAVLTDLRTTPASKNYIEITQAHEGENDYWRRCELLKKGYVFSYAPVIKTGTRKNRVVSIPPEATPVEERVETELERIRDAAAKKQGKDYPRNTSLIILFDDTPPFWEAIDNEKFDSFVNKNILNLDLRFSALYLVGTDTLREFSLVKRTQK
jgi:hypothetical protein